jgi:cytochrome c oxidase subunit 2
VRKLFSLLVSVSFGLAVAGSAAASNGGLSPVDAVSPNGDKVNTAYWLVFGLTAAIFVLVESALIVFVVKFRSRGRARTIEGPDIHGSTRLETVWTILPVLLLALIATFVLIELPGFTNPASAERADAVKVDVIAHQFYWEFRYANGATSYDTLVAPQGRLVELTITSEDAAHSWWIPAFGPKTDAIPGQENHAWFKSSRPGTFKGQCSELCGILHAKMTQAVRVVPEADYGTWLDAQAALSPVALGKQEFAASCAKCHGAQAEGFVGPDISEAAPKLNREALATLIRNGQGAMPAVAQGWSDGQVAALFAYLQSKPFEGGTSGQ